MIICSNNNVVFTYIHTHIKCIYLCLCLFPLASLLLLCNWVFCSTCFFDLHRDAHDAASTPTYLPPLLKFTLELLFPVIIIRINFIYDNYCDSNPPTNHSALCNVQNHSEKRKHTFIGLIHLLTQREWHQSWFFSFVSFIHIH